MVIALRRNLYIIVAIATSLILYSLLLHLAFNLDLVALAVALTQLDPRYLIMALLLRLASLVLHSTAWYMLLRINYKRTSFTKVLATVLTAIIVEFLVPIGGAAEVVKILLITQLNSVPSDVALASLMMHRQILITVTLITTTVAIYYKDISFGASFMLLLPAIGLLTVNTALLLAPTYRRFEVLINKLVGSKLPHFISQVNISPNNFLGRYREVLKMLTNFEKPELLVAVLITMLEKLSNSIYGTYVSALATLSIDLPSSLIAFDSIYTIVWLLPIITPGNLGIFEAIQTALLNVLGITPKLAAATALANRMLMVISAYPLIPLLATYLGINFKQIINNVSKYLTTKGSNTH